MLEDLKILLNIGDDDQDEKLSWILNATSQRLINILGILPIKDNEGKETPPTVPGALKHIVIDVSCARFNRIASEGMKSDSVEGESISFYDNDFDPYKTEIDAWLAMQKDDLTGGKGKVRFI